MLSWDWDAGKMREGGRCVLKRFAENADSCPRGVFVECRLCLGVGSRCSCPLLFINPIQSNGGDGGDTDQFMAKPPTQVAKEREGEDSVKFFPNTNREPNRHHFGQLDFPLSKIDGIMKIENILKQDVDVNEQ